MTGQDPADIVTVNATFLVDVAHKRGPPSNHFSVGASLGGDFAIDSTAACAWPVADTDCPEAQARQTLAFSRELLRELSWPVRPDGTAGSIHFYFALLYHCSVVRNIEVAEGSCQPALLYRLTAEFYRLYFESVIRRLRGDPGYRRAPLWDAYFRRAEAWDHSRTWIGLPLLIDAGVCAHVVGDLPEAIVTVCESQRSLDVVRAELFGPASTILYARTVADFSREIGETPLLPPRPFAAWLYRSSSAVLRAPIIGRLQTWRRGAIERASRALVSPPSAVFTGRPDNVAAGRAA